MYDKASNLRLVMAIVRPLSTHVQQMVVYTAENCELINVKFAQSAKIAISF